MTRLYDIHRAYALSTPEVREVVDDMRREAERHATPPLVRAALDKALSAVETAEHLEILDDSEDAAKADHDVIEAMDEELTRLVRVLHGSLKGAAARGSADPIGGPAAALLSLTFPKGTADHNHTRNGRRAAHLHTLVRTLQEPTHARLLGAIALTDVVARLDEVTGQYAELTAPRVPPVATPELVAARAAANEALSAAVLLALLVEADGAAPTAFRDPVVYPYVRVRDRLAAVYRARARAGALTEEEKAARKQARAEARQAREEARKAKAEARRAKAEAKKAEAAAKRAEAKQAAAKPAEAKAATEAKADADAKSEAAPTLTVAPAPKVAPATKPTRDQAAAK